MALALLPVEPARIELYLLKVAWQSAVGRGRGQLSTDDAGGCDSQAGDQCGRLREDLAHT